MYPQVFGKYVLERELSRGGMARVILATLRGAGGFEKRLVVKQIRDELSFDQQFVRRFVEEAKTTVALSHPNIVPVYELGVEQGTYFLAMELVEGASIAELVRERDEAGKRQVLSPEEGAYVGMEVCRALDYAHRRMKVVHRDITPRNVMLDEEGQVKLIDFGIAAPALVAGHEILGSPGHMPPEQVEGKELGPPTDIFAVAVLLMEAWSGVAPFRRATPELCDEAMRAPHPKPSDFDERLAPLDDVIGRAMRLDPRERPKNAAELGRALRGFLAGRDPTEVARPLGDRVRELRERAEPSAPPRSAAMRASAPSHGELGTQTFAARDDLAWTPSQEGAVAPLDSPSTRRLDDVVGAAPSSRRGQTGAKPAKFDPAMSIPTPLMVETSSADPSRTAPTERRPKVTRLVDDAEVKIETIATRPLETPVHAQRITHPPPARSKAPMFAFAAAVVVVVGGALAWRANTQHADTPPAPPASAPSASASTSPTLTASATLPTPPPPSPSAPPSETAAPVRTVAVPTIQTPASATVEKGARAMVTLLGDPGTRVLVDGAARGTCPKSVALEPGSHDVRFVFEPTGESRGQPLLVKAGEKITVRADFTRATPTITILR